MSHPTTPSRLHDLWPAAATDPAGRPGLLARTRRRLRLRRLPQHRRQHHAARRCNGLACMDRRDVLLRCRHPAASPGDAHLRHQPLLHRAGPGADEADQHRHPRAQCVLGARAGAHAAGTGDTRSAITTTRVGRSLYRRRVGPASDQPAGRPVRGPAHGKPVPHIRLRRAVALRRWVGNGSWPEAVAGF